MYGPHLADGVRALVRGTGDVAPSLSEAWASLAGGELAAPTAPPGTDAFPGLLVLRAPPLRWNEHTTLAGDAALIAALRTAARRIPLVLPVPGSQDPEPRSGAELARSAMAGALASLWSHPDADDAHRREVVSAARAANRLGRRLLRRSRTGARPGAAARCRGAGP